jgi:hypothetical protein
VFRQWRRAEAWSGVPDGGLTAGSYQTVVIRYTAGSLGLDEDGGLKLAFRFATDMGFPQTNDSRADDYVTASTSGTAELELVADRKATFRPFQRTLLVNVRSALMPGDTLDICLGDLGREPRLAAPDGRRREGEACEHPCPRSGHRPCSAAESAVRRPGDGLVHSRRRHRKRRPGGRNGPTSCV